MKSFTIKLLIFLSFSSNAQVKLNLSVNPNRQNTEYHTIHEDQDTLYLFGWTADPKYSFPYPNYLQSKFLLDNDTFVHCSQVIDSLYDFFVDRNVLKLKDGFIFTSKAIRASLSKTNGKVFYKTNKKGELIQYKFPKDTGSVRSDFEYIYMNDDSSFVVSGSYYDIASKYTMYPILYKLDKNGNVIKSNPFTLNLSRSVGDFSIGGMTKMSNKNFKVAVNETIFNCNINSSVFFLTIKEVDSNLRVVNSKIFDKTKVRIHNISEKASNQYFIFGIAIDSTICAGASIGMKGKPYVGLVDSGFNPIWEIKFSENNMINIHSFIKNVKKLNDNNYLAVGTYSTEMIVDKKTKGLCNAPLGLIFKFDSLGNVIWSRKYFFNSDKYCDNIFSINDFVELKNKNIVAVGNMALMDTIRDTSGQRGWVLLLDSLGNLLVKDTTKSSIFDNHGTTQVASTKIYPNPTTNFFKVWVEEKFQDFSIRIYDMRSRLILESNYKNKNEFEVDLSNFEKGVYHVHIETDGVTQIYSIVKK